MNDAFMSMAPSTEAAQSEPGPTEHAREPIPRLLYITLRLEEISAIIVEMAKERENLTAHLKVPRNDNVPDHKPLRQRRAYLTQRLTIVRKEQKDLALEKKAIGGAGRQGGGNRETSNALSTRGKTAT